MVFVSGEYKDKIYATERKISAEISFEIIDVEVYEDMYIYTSSEFDELSNLSQIYDKKREMPYKFATFERDYLKLDGSFHLPPLYDVNAQTGWWSGAISDEKGFFTELPTLTLLFTDVHSAMGLSMTFDIRANEYVEEFILDFFGETGEIIHSEHVTNNQETLFIMDRPVNNFKEVKITLIKTNNPFRRARIVEIDFGIIRYYKGDKLINLSILEEMDLLANVVPSNEITFTVDNSDQEFNILNPQGFYEYLKTNQEIRATFGLEIAPDVFEYVPMGKFFLQEWTIDEGAMTTTFIARDIFSSLELIEYPNLNENVTLYELAKRVLNFANVKEFILGNYLNNYDTKGFKEPLSVRAALQLIAIASKSVIRQNRYGSIVLEQFEPLTVSTGYVTYIGEGVFTGLTIPQVINDYDFNRIGFENAFEIPEISLNPTVLALKFKIHHHPTEDPNELTVYNANVKEGITYEIDNPLIHTNEHALKIAEWCFVEYNIRHHYVANWRQNPALEVGSPVVIEDAFGGMKKSRITKSEYNYEGALDGLSEAKGGI